MKQPTPLDETSSEIHHDGLHTATTGAKSSVKKTTLISCLKP